MRHLISALALTSVTACYDDGLYGEYEPSIGGGAISTGEGSTSVTSTASVTVTTTVTTTAGEGGSSTGIGSSTSAEGASEDVSEESAGEVGGDVGPIVSLDVAPPHLERAGLIKLTVDHTGDVSWLELWDKVEPGGARLAWSPDGPAPDYLLTRGDGLHDLTIRAYDDEGNVAVSEVATVVVDLPPSGTTLWEQTLEVGQATQGRVVASGWSKGELTLVTGLYSDSTALVGRHDAKGEPQLYTSPASSVSMTTGVVLMPDGSALAVGVDQIGITPRSWIAEVDVHTGHAKVIYQGALGEAATGLAVDHALGQMYISGYGPREGASAPDARLWARTLDGGEVWTESWERPVSKSKDKGRPTDRGWAVAVLDNGDPVMVGQSVLFPSDDDDDDDDDIEEEEEEEEDLGPEYWAFVLRYDPDGALGDARTWVSGEAFNFAGAYAVARDDDDGVLVAGWTSQDLTASRQATILTFDELLMPAAVHHYGPQGLWSAKAVVRLTTGEIVYLADVDIDEEGRSDVELRAINSSFGEASWTKTIPGEIGARSGGLTVTPEGHIIMSGTSIHDGGSEMLLLGIHP